MFSKSLNILRAVDCEDFGWLHWAGTSSPLKISEVRHESGFSKISDAPATNVWFTNPKPYTFSPKPEEPTPEPCTADPKASNSLAAGISLDHRCNSASLALRNRASSTKVRETRRTRMITSIRKMPTRVVVIICIVETTTSIVVLLSIVLRTIVVIIAIVVCKPNNNKTILNTSQSSDTRRSSHHNQHIVCIVITVRVVFNRPSHHDTKGQQTTARRIPDFEGRDPAASSVVRAPNSGSPEESHRGEELAATLKQGLYFCFW